MAQVYSVQDPDYSFTACPFHHDVINQSVPFTVATTTTTTVIVDVYVSCW